MQKKQLLNPALSPSVSLRPIKFGLAILDIMLNLNQNGRICYFVNQDGRKKPSIEISANLTQNILRSILSFTKNLIIMLAKNVGSKCCKR